MKTTLASLFIILIFSIVLAAQKGTTTLSAFGMPAFSEISSASHSLGEFSYSFGLGIQIPTKFRRIQLLGGIQLVKYGSNDIVNKSLVFEDGIIPEGNLGRIHVIQFGSQLRRVETIRYFSYLELPLGVRFNVTQGRFRLYISSAIVPAIYLEGKDFIKIEGGKTKKNKLDNEDYRRLNLHSNFGVGVLYKMNPHFGVFLEPNRSYQMLGIKSKSNEYGLYNIGGKVGVTWQFTKKEED